MALTFAVAGKGGSGKSTVAAMIVRLLREQEKRRPLLAIDADPNSTLGDLLGIAVSVDDTIASIREDATSQKNPLPPGITKNQFVEDALHRRIIEDKAFDLLTMGRPEGPRCYCYVNTLLRKFLDELRRSYQTIIIDNEAGMEHLSRQTTHNIDHLLLVSDATVTGIKAALRIRDLADTLSLSIGKFHLLINKVPNTGLTVDCEKLSTERTWSTSHCLPFSEEIASAASSGDSVFALGNDNQTLLKVQDALSDLMA